MIHGASLFARLPVIKSEQPTLCDASVRLSIQNDCLTGLRKTGIRFITPRECTHGLLRVDFHRSFSSSGCDPNPAHVAENEASSEVRSPEGWGVRRRKVGESAGGSLTRQNDTSRRGWGRMGGPNLSMVQEEGERSYFAPEASDQITGGGWPWTMAPSGRRSSDDSMTGGWGVANSE